MNDMIRSDLLTDLYKAQELLSNVYHYACENKITQIERLTSIADSCIIDSINFINEG